MLKIPRVINVISRLKKFRPQRYGIIERSVHQFNFNSEEEIITNHLEQVMLIGINLPDTKNLLNETALKKLDDCINDFGSNSKFSVAILHGYGGNFCTGTVSTRKAITMSQNLIKTLHTVQKPIIGALNGNTTSFGLLLAIMCDMRTMEQGSLVGLGDNSEEIEILPLIYERLILNIGLAGTVELLCTQRMWCDSKCLSTGFTTLVVKHGCVLGQAISLAQSIAFNTSLKNIIQRKSKIISCFTGKS